jgi:hypothetical protein
MKQKSKQRKRKHTQATQKAHYKSNDINAQHHVRHRPGKKGVKMSKLKGTLGRLQSYRLKAREDITA